MPDIYETFAELAKNNTLGEDYGIKCNKRDSQVLIIAPHGGTIEPGTSRIARKIAGAKYSYYLFEGLKKGAFRRLHITSHHFDEDRALKILAKSLFAVGIHGRQDKADRDSVWLGGLDRDLVGFLELELAQANFMPRVHDHPFQAREPDNICNRGMSKRGAQLELPHTLRQTLRKDQNEMARFSNAVKRAIETRLRQYRP